MCPRSYDISDFSLYATHPVNGRTIVVHDTGKSRVGCGAIGRPKMGVVHMGRYTPRPKSRSLHSTPSYASLAPCGVSLRPITGACQRPSGALSTHRTVHPKGYCVKTGATLCASEWPRTYLAGSESMEQRLCCGWAGTQTRAVGAQTCKCGRGSLPAQK